METNTNLSNEILENDKEKANLIISYLWDNGSSVKRIQKFVSYVYPELNYSVDDIIQIIQDQSREKNK